MISESAAYLQRLVIENDVARTKRLEPRDKLVVGNLPSWHRRTPDDSNASELENGAELDEDLPYCAVGRVDHHSVPGLRQDQIGSIQRQSISRYQSSSSSSSSLVGRSV